MSTAIVINVKWVTVGFLYVIAVAPSKWPVRKLLTIGIVERTVVGFVPAVC
jgi:hypothetical protein